MEYSFVDPIFGIPVVLNLWKVIGLTGALMFGSRWIVQFYYSRKAGRPVTPRIFWIMSIVGSLMTLSYFLFGPKRDMVGILQNVLPCAVAVFNLYLDLAHKPGLSPAAANHANDSQPKPAKAEPASKPETTPSIPQRTPALEPEESVVGGQ